ncbi:hypothetical protein OHS70_14585 [Streptomyces sp. NBC_00390]|uniref:hypothetical protein n=1 Tax=Streptomyces sp. NBC_00390 TaxID=2975736 RepID=UPI002E1BFFD2
MGRTAPAADRFDRSIAESSDAEARRESANSRGLVTHTFVVEAPGEYAEAVARLVELAWSQRRSLFFEAVAEHWTWRQVGPHLSDPELRHLVAHSRVLRGEDLARASGSLGPELFGDIPFALQTWEAEFWDVENSPMSYGRHGSAGGFDGIPVHDVTARVGLPLPDTGATALTWTAPPPLPSWATNSGSYAEVAGPLHCTAAQALARHLSGLPRHERLTQAVPVPFAAAYPGLLKALGGQGAYTSESMALGRIAVWRLLRRMARLPDDSPADTVSEHVAGLDCLTWELPGDDIWYFHLAADHPATGTSWLVDGQDFD